MPPDPATTLAEIVKLSGQIAALRRPKNGSKVPTYADALAIQSLQRKRRTLWSQLPAFKLVENTSCAMTDQSEHLRTSSGSA